MDLLDTLYTNCPTYAQIKENRTQKYKGIQENTASTNT